MRSLCQLDLELAASRADAPGRRTYRVSYLRRGFPLVSQSADQLDRCWRKDVTATMTHLHDTPHDRPRARKQNRRSFTPQNWGERSYCRPSRNLTRKGENCAKSTRCSVACPLRRELSPFSRHCNQKPGGTSAATGIRLTRGSVEPGGHANAEYGIGSRESSGL